ncbi:MAG: hypothetical protein OEZ36_05935 [Spirochaetota bacterium]|nr:hypothetical protein [Spirochaetota bacterium]
MNVNKIRKTWLLAFVLMTLTLNYCDPVDENTVASSPKHSCNADLQDFCTHFNGTGWTETTVRNQCPDIYTSAGCPTSVIRGKCVQLPGSAYESTWYYYSTIYDDPATLTLAGSACTGGGGNWTLY